MLREEYMNIGIDLLKRARGETVDSYIGRAGPTFKPVNGQNDPARTLRRPDARTRASRSFRQRKQTKAECEHALVLLLIRTEINLHVR